MSIYAWIWLTIALICLVLEIITNAFILIFFAGSAFLVAVGNQFGLENLTYQIISFGFFGFLGLLFFREKIKQTFSKHTQFSSSDENQILILEQDLPPNEESRVSYQGSVFTGINVSHQLLPARSRARIVKTDGIKLHLIPEDLATRTDL